MLDFKIEAANARSLAAATPADCGVRLPRVYDDLSTGRVVEEQVSGVSITDVETLEAQGLDPAVLATTLLRVTLGQVFDAGSSTPIRTPGTSWSSPTAPSC